MYNYSRERERREAVILKKKEAVSAPLGPKAKISLLLLATWLLMLIPHASAHLASPVNSPWTTNIPTIDGTISSGEWTDATVRDFTLYMRSRLTGALNQTLDARLYVKNDGNNIYAAVKIFNEDYDAEDFIGGWDVFGLFFEENHDGVLSDGDNGEGFANYPSALWYINNDLYWNSTANTWLEDTGVGGANDGAIAWSHTNPVEDQIGTYTIETRIPLVGSDGDTLDLAITSLPKTLGFKIWFYEMDEGIDGVYPDDTGTATNVLETKDGNTFGDLVLAESPPPPVGGMAAPIAIPTNKPSLLTPLIWLASVIILPIALTVVFVKLKKKKL